jgi:hypothetical protein
MAIQIRKAERRKAKLRIGVSGPSGSGKTYSSLLLARGMTTAWNKVGLIDTENGSGELYSHLGDYNVITLTAPFTPESYIEAIQAFEKAGIEALVIDSVSHEWDGPGGCLEIVDKLGGKYQDWGKVTPRHQAFVQTILMSPLHIITTTRRKQDYEMTKSGDGKVKVEKMGLKEVQRDGFEYELTLAFEVTTSHLARASKDRTGLFMDKPEFVISEATGQLLTKWNETGAANPVDLKRQVLAQFKRLDIELPPEMSDYPAYLRMAIPKITGLAWAEENLEGIVAKMAEFTDGMEAKALIWQKVPAPVAAAAVVAAAPAPVQPEPAPESYLDNVPDADPTAPDYQPEEEEKPINPGDIPY